MNYNNTRYTPPGLGTGTPTWVSDNVSYPYTYPPQPPSVPQPIFVDKTIDQFGDAELILELIKRGYAVAQMPAEELAEAVGS